MGHILAFNIHLDNEVWEMLELCSVAGYSDISREIFGNIYKSSIVNGILKKNLPKMLAELPGNILDENTPLGKVHAFKEKQTDDSNKRLPQYNKHSGQISKRNKKNKSS